MPRVLAAAIPCRYPDSFFDLSARRSGVRSQLPHAAFATIRQPRDARSRPGSISLLYSSRSRRFTAYDFGSGTRLLPQSWGSGSLNPAIYGNPKMWSKLLDLASAKKRRELRLADSARRQVQDGASSRSQSPLVLAIGVVFTPMLAELDHTS
jgi:hypothetical protein